MPLSWSLTGRFLWAGLAGMETTAFAAVSVGAVWLYHRRRLGSVNGSGLDAWTGLLFGLASQMRPEGHLLFGLVVLDSLYRWLQARNAEAARQALLGVVAYGLITVPYLLFGLNNTGRPLPNT